MPFHQHDRLWNRSFIGLLIAQFQAAFSDQAVHASAMFYAINQDAMSESNAISLMPILFYAPWAIFCTLAGYLADRYSKRFTIVFWKMFEIGIVLVSFLGFYLGTVHGYAVGPFLVLSTVFLMGMQSAFFVPGKYGIMPEILKPRLLSRGNGWLESLSFLAVILGTVTGGILSFVFRGQEYWIGAILVVLSVLGAAASLLVERVPAANPTRPFPRNLVRPIFDNLRILFRTRPLAMAVLGIAFFTFMVAFMRATMYMHGESRIPKWTEMHTSIVVGVIALGIGLGSPMAGYLSGGKIELGLVPLGSVGMILALLVAAFTLNLEPALVACLVAIGFFAGFYIVPMFTMLQHRAPKERKGDLVASSNFINVVGAIAASVLFKGLVVLAELSGVIHPIPSEAVARGELTVLASDWGTVEAVEVRDDAGGVVFRRSAGEKPAGADVTVLESEGPVRAPRKGRPGTDVEVLRYRVLQDGRLAEHYRVRPVDRTGPVYNREPLTKYLFLGAAIMTLGILLALIRLLPDLPARTALWLWARRRYRLDIDGLENIPNSGPAVLATDCDSRESAMQVVGVSDRRVIFLLVEAEGAPRPSWLLRWITGQTGARVLPAADLSGGKWQSDSEYALTRLKQGRLIGLTATAATAEVDSFLAETVAQDAPIIPVHCASTPAPGARWHFARVVIGTPLPPGTPPEEVRAAVQKLGAAQETRDEG